MLPNRNRWKSKVSKHFIKQRYKLKTPYSEKPLQASLSLNHVVSKTTKPPLLFLSSSFSQSVDTTGRSSCEEDIVIKSRIIEEASLLYYSLCRKTVNARENFWNIYFFSTNQMRDETAKDNRQTAMD